jgi:hypothetical protein
MRFKTPAPLFNVNGDHGARARRLFVYKSIQDQDPTIIIVVVGCGGSYCQGVMSWRTKNFERLVIPLTYKCKTGFMVN